LTGEIQEHKVGSLLLTFTTEANRSTHHITNIIITKTLQLFWIKFMIHPSTAVLCIKMCLQYFAANVF